MERHHHDRMVGSASFTAQADVVMDAIRARAHDLWEAAGRPEGHAWEYWMEAEAEVIGRMAARKI